MKREILCPDCAANLPLALDVEDRANGFTFRTVALDGVKTPPNHGIEINGKRETLSAIHCDRCNETIPDGSPAVAVTTWNTNREGEPRAWEGQYEQ